MPKHPAVFSDSILDAIADVAQEAGVRPHWLTLDPFAGTGRVHELNLDTIGVEIEPEWATMHPRTVVGDALSLPFAEETFDAIITSPCYGNRMADHHDAKDGSQRITYKHTLGHDLHSHNSGQLQWGRAYRDFHELAWAEAARALCFNGRLILNVSNHIRKGEEVNVCDWHVNTLVNLGFRWERMEIVKTPRMKYGANKDLRTGHEYVFCLIKDG